MILKNAYVLVNSVNLSTFVKRVQLSDNYEGLDNTTMGPTRTAKTEEPGLQTPGISVDLLQSYAAGEVDATISGLRGTTFPIEVRATADAVGPTNPKWTATVFVKSYNPVAGQVGEQVMATVEFGMASGLTRATS